MKGPSEFEFLLGGKSECFDKSVFAYGVMEIGWGLMLRLWLPNALVHEVADRQTAELAQNQKGVGLRTRQRSLLMVTPKGRWVPVLRPRLARIRES